MTTQTLTEAGPGNDQELTPVSTADAGRRAVPVHSEFESQVIARIRQWLADNEWTAFSLARSVGVSPSYAQRILSGKLRGSTRVLSALASAAGLGWGDLVDIVRGYADDERGAVWVGQRRFKRRHLPR